MEDKSKKWIFEMLMFLNSNEDALKDIERLIQNEGLAEASKQALVRVANYLRQLLATKNEAVTLVEQIYWRRSTSDSKEWKEKAKKVLDKDGRL